jgi:hypothetical protein
LRFTFADLVTVLKVVTHYQHTSDHGNYARRSPEHEYLSILLGLMCAAEIRDVTQRDVDHLIDHRSMLAPHPETRAQRFAHRLLINRLTAVLYRFSGVDGWELYSRFARRERGDVLRDAIKKRTADTLPEPPDVPSMVAQIRAREVQ